jgi:hypothetical protein
MLDIPLPKGIMTTDPDQLPNPDTYLNHLTAVEGDEFEICRNITLAVLGVGKSLAQMQKYL